MSTIARGEQCPQFSLPDDDGQIASLADLAGHPFVLFFYPKDDTSGCTQEAVEFSALRSAFAALGVEVLGVSPDSLEKHRKFRKKHGLSVRLLSDEEKTLIGKCGLWIEKSMYGKRYMGVERTTVLISEDGVVARLWHKVKVPGHAREVLEAAKCLAESR